MVRSRALVGTIRYTDCNTTVSSVPVIGIETHGSNCFYQSLSLNAGSFPGSPFPPQNGVEVVTDPVHDVKIARLPKLTSRAGSLGASWPSPGVVKMALQRKGGLKSVCVSDEMAMQTGLQFAGSYCCTGSYLGLS